LFFTIEISNPSTFDVVLNSALIHEKSFWMPSGEQLNQILAPEHTIEDMASRYSEIPGNLLPVLT
jgi:hypothetical protein